MILDFENDQLKGVRGDVIPAGAGDAGATDAVVKPEGAKPVAPQKKEKGLIDKLKFWKGDEAPAQAAPQPEPATGPLKAPAQVIESGAPAPKAVEPASPAVAEPKQATPKPVAPAKAEPAKPSAPKSESVPKAVEPEPTKAEPAKVEPKQATIPADDLPPEDDPGYFERMLEKIGF